MNLLVEILSWNFDSTKVQASLLDASTSTIHHSNTSDNDDNDDSVLRDELSETLLCTGEQWQMLFAPIMNSSSSNNSSPTTTSTPFNYNTDSIHYYCFQVLKVAQSDVSITTLAGRALILLAGVGKQLFISDTHRLQTLSSFLMALTHISTTYMLLLSILFIDLLSFSITYLHLPTNQLIE